MRRTQDIGLGIRTTRDGDRWRVEVVDLAHLRKWFGDDLLIAFARAFAGADRLLTLHQHLGSLREGGDPVSTRYQRDTLNLILFIWSITRELAEVISALAAAGIADCLDKETASWQALWDLRGRWRGSGLQADFRNELGVHFSPQRCREGLERWTSDPPKGELLTIMWGDGTREMDASFSIGTLLIVAGLTKREEGGWAGLADVMAQFAKERVSDHVDFADHLQRLFLQVVENKSRRAESGS